ncbi:MAG: hypothetical protein WC763_00390 [Candidatus Paceibacterota bacterium]|jgi:hypothetical protein
MSISHILIKIKAFAHILDRRDVWACSCIVLAGAGGYMAGRIDPLRPPAVPVRIEMGQGIQFRATSSAASVKSASKDPVPVTSTSSAKTGKYVASKTGTKYHLPTCAGARTISNDNKIWFTTKEEAEKAGYAPAGNCKGI